MPATDRTTPTHPTPWPVGVRPRCCVRIARMTHPATSSLNPSRRGRLRGGGDDGSPFSGRKTMAVPIQISSHAIQHTPISVALSSTS